MRVFIASLICVLSLLILDGLWLTVVAKSFYRANIGHLLSDRVNWGAAALFYFIFITGVMTFVVIPCLQEGNLVKALLLGAAFGFVTYATYDLTNNATLREWPYLVTIVDLAWGSFLTATVSSLSVWLSRSFSS